MRTTPFLIAMTLALTVLAGCFGDNDDTAEPEQPPATKAPANADPPEQPPEEPEPFEPVEVFNQTMHFDVQPAAGASFDVPEGAESLSGSIDVMAREVCSTLQRNQDQEGPSVVITAPSDKEKSFTLTQRAALCGTNDEPLERFSVLLPSEAGSWSVTLVGVGNVDVEIALTAV